MKISCLMPTHNRRSFIASAINCYQKQYYENKELIILDDGSDKIEDIVISLNDNSIHYYTCSKCSLGEKLNLCNNLASGEVRAHFDDDDWSAPNRLSIQSYDINQGNSITGFSHILYLDINTSIYYEMKKPSKIYGISLAYTKKAWESVNFLHLIRGTDMPFIFNLSLKGYKIGNIPTEGIIVGRIHRDQLTPWLRSNMLKECSMSIIPTEFTENERMRLNG